MSTSHTPGPWVRGASLISDGHREIALVREPCRYKDGSSWTPNGAPETMAEYEGNCDLIAAAPDLLAALVALLPHAARRIQGTTDGEPILARARAAIAKAEGRS